MTRDTEWQALMVDALSGELDPDQQSSFEQQLARSPARAQQWRELQATWHELDQHLPARPEPGELNAWRAVSSALAGDASAVGLGQSQGAASRLWPPALRWITGAGAAAGILVLGILIGRTTLDTNVSVGDPLVQQTPTESADLSDQYARFLERSTPLLMAVANHSNGRPLSEAVGLERSAEQQIAAQLAAEAITLGIELRTSGRAREARLVENLEVVFMQIANLTENDYPDSLNLVQATLQQRAILFQLTVEEMRRARTASEPLG